MLLLIVTLFLLEVIGIKNLARFDTSSSLKDTEEIRGDYSNIFRFSVGCLVYLGVGLYNILSSFPILVIKPTVSYPVAHYVAASTRWRFLTYDLITIQNWCHLYLILHYLTQFMCTEAFGIDV